MSVLPLGNKELRLAMLGMVEGNGHPYSWSAIVNGRFDPERMKADYAFTQKYFEIEAPFDIEQAYTNEFLDTELKMPVVESSAN